MKRNNILVITYWSFDNALVQTYTLPYLLQIRRHLSADSSIFLFTLSNANSPMSQALHQLKANLAQQNIHVLGFTYRKFGPLMALKLAGIILYLGLFAIARRINYLHAWCTPGGAIAYLVALISRKPIVLDSFEPHAETMVEGKTWTSDDLAYKILFRLEKLQLKKAREVICATEGMIVHSQTTYGIVKPRYFVKPACVNLELFNPNTKRETLENMPLKKIVCVYAGKFGGIYLENEVFDFMKTAYDYWRGDFSLLLLTSHSDEEIERFCKKSGFPTEAVVKKFVPHGLVPAYMSLGSFGICPVKPMPSKRFCTPIKNGEYWAMGLPVVITKNISDDSHVIKENDIGYVLEELNREEYLRAVKKIEGLLEAPGDLKARIREIAVQKRNFISADAIYEEIYS